jgi:hypothetical protein
LNDFDIPLEVRSLFDRDPSSFDLPHNPALAAKLSSVARFDVPFDGADNTDVLRFDFGLDSCLRTNGQAVVANKRAVYFTIYLQILIAEDFTLDANAAAQMGGRAAFGPRKIQNWRCCGH